MKNHKFNVRTVVSARVEAGLNQSEMASALGITRQTYSAKESGRRSFTIEELNEISSLVSKPVDFFFRSYVTEKQHK